MDGYFVYYNINDCKYYLITVYVFNYRSNYENYKEYFTNDFKISKIEDIYGNSCYFGLFNINYITDCKFRICKNIVLDELYDKYMNTDIDLKIAKEINLYTFDGKLSKSYFMNNFKIEGEYKEYHNGELRKVTNYINGQIIE